ncbi:hypothetical protein GALL_464730 [mine drainage metagenome]|uniref:Uncharacterized protein n=1 Tax=mine drainage metagenome TaxID=410659 RepID=A0A1J5PL75_9ZZZZ
MPPRRRAPWPPADARRAPVSGRAGAVGNSTQRQVDGPRRAWEFPWVQGTHWRRRTSVWPLPARWPGATARYCGAAACRQALVHPHRCRQSRAGVRTRPSPRPGSQDCGCATGPGVPRQSPRRQPAGNSGRRTAASPASRRSAAAGCRTPRQAGATLPVRPGCGVPPRSRCPGPRR